MRKDARDLSLDDRSQLGGDQRADLRLCLGNSEPERERGNLFGRPLLPDQLVPYLGTVPVGDHEPWTWSDQIGQTGLT